VVVEHPEHCRVRADRELLECILRVLVGNAIRHAGMRAEIRVLLGSRPGCSFFVRDNGSGFEPARAARLFAPPVAADGIGHRGLAAMAAHLVRAGGRIEAEAEPGWGATFFVTLPP
jgi:signal transduction histidine kinase